MNILEVVNLTSDELETNLSGKLSHQQKRFMKMKRSTFAAGALSFFILLALLIITISIKFRFPSFASRGELFVGLPIGLLWLCLLRSFPRLWVQTSQELREGNALTADGQVQCEISGNVGLIQIPHYQIRLAEHNLVLVKR
jgi:hypothetical protein